MSKGIQAEQRSESLAKPAPTFKQMTLSEKYVLLLKVVAFLATFGFAFPTVLEDF